MLVAALVYFLAGTCAGMRLSAHALAVIIPAGLAGSLALAAAGLIGPGAWIQAGLWACLQIGYFLGAVLETGLVRLTSDRVARAET